MLWWGKVGVAWGRVRAKGKWGCHEGRCNRKRTAGPARDPARVKRRGKSAPPLRRRRGDGKPHLEQDRYGIARATSPAWPASIRFRVGRTSRPATARPEE